MGVLHRVTSPRACEAVSKLQLIARTRQVQPIRTKRKASAAYNAREQCTRTNRILDRMSHVAEQL